MLRLPTIVFLIGLTAGLYPAAAQAPAAATARPTPPTRDPNTPGYVMAKELPDGVNAPANADGNFILGATHNPSPETTVQEGVPQGTVYNFTMSSADSKIYPGIARDQGTFGAVDPADPAKLIVTTSHPAAYTRRVAVYVPKQYVPGTTAPFIVGADGPDQVLFPVLDNLIAQKRLPVMIAISIGNGSGDAQGSQRGLEYDTMSGRYAEFVETEVLPLVEKQYNVKLTKDPEGRLTMGGSSGGAAALSMAWYHPELYHRVLAYSGTWVNQQWPPRAETPHGAWEYHEHLIPNSPVKPIRIWMEVGDRDLFNPNVMRDNMHDWVVANENMAKVLAAKGYHYQFVFARNAGHTDGAVKRQTLAEALEYVWQGYPITAQVRVPPSNSPKPSAPDLEFEVAAIKPAKPLTPAMIQAGQFHMTRDNAVFEVSTISLMSLITMAYEIKPDLVSGPGWLQEENFSVAAKLPAGASQKDVPAMLRRLLADRFKLAAHLDQKIQPVLFLKVAKQGSRLSAASPDDDPSRKGCQGRPGHTVCRSASMADLADTLTTRAKMNALMGLALEDATREIDLPVVDQTDLAGAFDFDLEWIVGAGAGGGRGGAVAPARNATTATSIIEALQAVGLRLERGKHPFDFLVIDHVERPSEN